MPIPATKHLALQVHNAAFPSDPEEDIGRGSPYSRGADRLLEFAARLGFDIVQLGPSGMTDRGNASPYDGSFFSRNPLDLPLARMIEQGRLSRTTLNSLRRSLPPPRNGVSPYPLVHDAYRAVVREIVAGATSSDREAARRFLSIHESWLLPDALFEALSDERGSRSWREWSSTPNGALDQRLFDPPEGREGAARARLSALRERHAGEIADYALVQWILAEEHRAFRERLGRLGLAAYGDLQVGLSNRDTWACQRLLLPGYRMGAPPSRTNPDGQPWGYSVLDPDQFGSLERPGPALEFVRSRIERMRIDFDGLRVDHPHGWVDPWVYRADDPDPFHAVRSGARLFSSPDDPRHPRLAKFAIARADQLDRSQPAFADGRVTNLDDEQVRRYAFLVDEIAARRVEGERPPQETACEVLSTLPYPVARVLARHGLGRFRVTQKLNLSDPSDVYRIEHARAEDWIMLGTHDTPPIRELAERWCRGREGMEWARYLATFLTDGPRRETFRTRVAESAGELVTALFAAMLGSAARHVLVFFPDLFGLTTRYNEPGTVNETNWSLRVPADFEAIYADRVKRGMALDIARCREMAETAASDRGELPPPG